MSDLDSTIYPGREFRAPLDMDPHLFYELDGGFAMFLRPMPFTHTFFVGQPIPLSCMFDAHWLVDGDEQRIGYVFSSRFQVQNAGGYIVTFMESKRGLANAVEVLIKTDDLIVFHYPNKGTMAVIPKVSVDLETILQEQ
jgi:hypothetical protein